MGGLIDIDHAALAPYWCTHNATAAQWMLIFCECYCPLRQSCFSSNINKMPEAWKRLKYAGNRGFVFLFSWDGGSDRNHCVGTTVFHQLWLFLWFYGAFVDLTLNFFFLQYPWILYHFNFVLLICCFFYPSSATPFCLFLVIFVCLFYLISSSSWLLSPFDFF